MCKAMHAMSSTQNCLNVHHKAQGVGATKAHIRKENCREVGEEEKADAAETQKKV